MTKRTVKLTKSDLLTLYASNRFLRTQTRKNLKLSIPFEVYFQDPAVAAEHPEFGFDKDCFVDWEPGLTDGPTSARFAVVDYNADTDTLVPPAKWDSQKLKFVYHGLILDKDTKNNLQFHQVNVWAILQRALRFFEGPNGLGRRIPWGFEGNRLLVRMNGTVTVDVRDDQHMAGPIALQYGAGVGGEGVVRFRNVQLIPL